MAQQNYHEGRFQHSNLAEPAEKGSKRRKRRSSHRHQASSVTTKGTEHVDASYSNVLGDVQQSEALLHGVWVLHALFEQLPVRRDKRFAVRYLQYLHQSYRRAHLALDELLVARQLRLVARL